MLRLPPRNRRYKALSSCSSDVSPLPIRTPNSLLQLQRMSSAVSTSCMTSLRPPTWRCNATKEWSNLQHSSQLLLPPESQIPSQLRHHLNTNERTPMIGTTVSHLPLQVQIDPLPRHKIGLVPIMEVRSLLRPDTNRGNSISLQIIAGEHFHFQLSISVLKLSRVDQLSRRMQPRDNLRLPPRFHLLLPNLVPATSPTQTLLSILLSTQTSPPLLRISPTFSLNLSHLQSLLPPLNSLNRPCQPSRPTPSLTSRLHSPIQTSQLRPHSIPCSTSTSKQTSSHSYHPHLLLRPQRVVRTRSLRMLEEQLRIFGLVSQLRWRALTTSRTLEEV